MNTKKKLISLTLAAAAISFAALPITSTSAFAHTKHVKCYGVNTCKGHSKCKTAKNACKGKNSCKGEGVVKMSAKKCEKLGGTLEEPK